MTGSRSLKIGMILLAIGLVASYLLERYNIFTLWGNSRYAISWADLFYPPLCVLLSLTGLGLVIDGLTTHSLSRSELKFTLSFVIPLTLLYTLFVFAIQFIQTGADRLGECPGLEQAASSSNVIPQSKSLPDRKAVGCGVERRGIFLSYYNEMTIYRVTELGAQQQVLDKIADYYHQAHTHPVRVMFYREENWTVTPQKSGVLFGSRGPEKLIRVARIG